MARPTDYREEFCGRVIELGRKGKSKAQIAAALDVSRQTLDAWTKAHPEFLDAINAARDLAQAWWEDQGQTGLYAERFNATAFIFQMKNRFRDDYADATAVKHSGAIGTFDASKHTDAELAALASVLGASAAGGRDAEGGEGGDSEAGG